MHPIILVIGGAHIGHAELISALASALAMARLDRHIPIVEVVEKLAPKLSDLASKLIITRPLSTDETVVLPVTELVPAFPRTMGIDEFIEPTTRRILDAASTPERPRVFSNTFSF